MCVLRWFAHFRSSKCVFMQMKSVFLRVSMFMHWLNFWSAASFLRQIDAKCTGTCEVYVNVVLQHLTHLVLKTSGRLNSPAAWGVRDSRVSARHWICFCQHVHKVVSNQRRWVVLWRQTDKVKKKGRTARQSRSCWQGIISRRLGRWRPSAFSTVLTVTCGEANTS